MPTPLRIDFVSDVVCPWCAVGLWSLNTALERLKGEVTAELRFRPFELNPNMGPDGETIVEHIGKKYGSTPEQSAANRAAIRERAAVVGFEMNLTGYSRIWNTFDCHRLLHWAGEIGPDAQARLKAELLTAHFTLNRPLNDPETLITAAEAAGLDGAEARAVLTENRYADAVRAEQAPVARPGDHRGPGGGGGEQMADQRRPAAGGVRTGAAADGGGGLGLRPPCPGGTPPWAR